MINKFNDECNQKNINNALNLVKKLVKKNVIAHIFDDVKVCNKGSLKGVPIVIKDNFATTNAKTSASSKIIDNFYPHYDATIIKLLKKAGGSIVAKTQLDELGLGGTGLSSSYGIIKNPINSEYIVGGSSSGSAYCIHNDQIGVAIGSDTGDSVRKPASYVGKVGFKPSYGAVSRYGLVTYASSLDTVSWFTHSVYDSAIISNILFKKDFNDFSNVKVDFNVDNVKLKKPKKIGFIFHDDYFSKNIKTHFDKLIINLKKQDIIVEKVAINQKFIKALLPAYEVISYSEATSNLSNLSGVSFGNRKSGNNYQEIMTNTRSAGFEEAVQRRMILGSFFLSKENQSKFFLKAQKVRRVLATLWAKLYDKYDVIIYPAQTKITKKIVDINNQKNNCYDDLMLFSNFLGSPSITIPFAQINEMPFGLNINGNTFEDEKLLSIAMYFEQFIKENNE